MSAIKNKDLLLCFEESFDELFSLETIIKLTQESCFIREEDSVYYNLPQDEKIILSEERNHYINMLTLALDKVHRLKKVSTKIEQEISVLYAL